MHDEQKRLIDRRTFIGISATAAASTAVFLSGWGTGDLEKAYGIPGGGLFSDGEVFTIVHTNDVHSYVDVLPYVRGLVDDLASSSQAYSLVSAGDDFAGTPFATLSAGQDVVELMNRAKYDMFTIGNHEYMMNPSDLTAALGASQFSILACNVLSSTKATSPHIKDYEIIEFAGRKIAFIGIAYSQADSPDLFESLERARGLAEADGANYFIGISHLGLSGPPDAQLSTEVAQACPWFTAIIDGHSHTELPAGQIENGVLIVQTGEYGNNIGVTEIQFDDTGVTGAAARLIKIKGNESSCGIVPNADMQNYIAQVNERNDAYVNEVVFSLPELLPGERAVVRTKETSLGNLFADAMRIKTGSAIALLTGAFIRNDLGPGEITRGTLQTTVLSETQLALVDLTGAQILRAIERGLEVYPDQNAVFPHISGLNVVFDKTKVGGGRIVKAALPNGQAIDPHALYSCTVRENVIDFYLGEGFAYVDGVDYHTGHGSQSDAIIDLVNGLSAIPNAIDGRLRVLGESFILRFDGNGATDGSHVPIMVVPGESVTLPACAYIKAGSRFISWVDNAGNRYADEVNLENIEFNEFGELILTAQWEDRTPSLVLDKQSYLPGETVSFSGNDFEPQLDVVFTIHSDPVQVATIAASAVGAVVGSFMIPKNVAPGNHTLVANNGLHQASIPLAISQATGLSSGGSADGMAKAGDDAPLYAAATITAAAAAAATAAAIKNKAKE